MRLFIAEKPDVAKAIVAALGVTPKREDGYFDCGNDKITWCFGHMLALCDPEDYDERYAKWNKNDLPIINIPWKYKKIPKSKKQLNIILSLLKEADEIVNASDPDEEGQLLCDEILVYANNKKPVKRLLINDNNINVVKKALNNLRDNSEFYGLYQSALARSVADQMYGYNMTRVCTLSGREKGLSNVLSVGRVQTPILGLVVHRDRINEDHKASKYYTLTGHFDFDNQAVSANFKPKSDDPIDDKKRVISKEFIEKVAKTCKNKHATIVNVHSEEKEAAPPLPYNLLSLQADASRKFNISPDETLTITQNLREKYKLITYNRSDCEYLSDEQHEDATGVLAAIAETAPALKGAASKGDPSIKSRAFNSANVSAHHAIIPTEATANLEGLSKQEQQIYLLIARQYIAQFFPKQLYRQTGLSIECEGYEYQVTSKMILRAGWTALYKNDQDNDQLEAQGDTDKDLSIFKTNTEGFCTDTMVEEKETKPPARYTEATLLKDLACVAKYISDPEIKKSLIEKDKGKKGEHGGIGTPATRSTILKNLLDRGYLEKKNKKIISTKLGREFHDVLPKSAVVPDMTAIWHQQQKLIQDNSLNLNQFLEEFCGYLSAEVERIKAEGLAIKANVHFCPECTKALRRIKGKNGYFWGCTGYQDGCKASYPDNKGEPDLTLKPKPKAVVSSFKCEACGSGLIRRPGKRVGRKVGASWWGCSGFPTCKQRYSDEYGKPNYCS
ncbi:DNA topoisomerase 3 [Zooshikella marina]|uniref:DNA topoisomerase 3 n=1 Tax=Zooshikella ganghwensis TaxID=202772 RepID=UPI001BAFB878|nr:DNA topoisomerase 3 [Zooshikella ganghwensis]MBU2708704.1 DNA topoisomerase 3 [Zooshikella ganghwensis]